MPCHAPAFLAYAAETSEVWRRDVVDKDFLSCLQVAKSFEPGEYNIIFDLREAFHRSVHLASDSTVGPGRACMVGFAAKVEDTLLGTVCLLLLFKAMRLKQVHKFAVVPVLGTIVHSGYSFQVWIVGHQPLLVVVRYHIPGTRHFVIVSNRPEN